MHRDHNTIKKVFYSIRSRSSLNYYVDLRQSNKRCIINYSPINKYRQCFNNKSFVLSIVYYCHQLITMVSFSRDFTSCSIPTSCRSYLTNLNLAPRLLAAH